MLKYPLVKIVIPFIAGIMLGYFINFSQTTLLILSAAGLIILFISVVVFKNKFELFRSIIVTATIIVMAATFYQLSNLTEDKYPFAQTRYSNAIVFAKINAISLQNENNYKLVILTDSIRVGDETKTLNIQLLTRIFPKVKSDSIYNSLHIGNLIQIEGTIKKGRGKRNPGEYDYQEYLESINISALLDVYDSTPTILNSQSDLLSDFIHQIRKGINSRILQLHNDETAALLRGLLLADRTSIDYELKESFVNAGVVHVLAVSGLHVGYIMLIFLVLFNRANIILRYFLTALGLIFFLLITGSPPSVFRATIMAIILLLSGLSSRQYNAVNSLSLAALILLLLNPNELFMPGFQLSFSAVLSILVLFPIIKKMVVEKIFNSVVLKNIFLFLTVTLSAQIGTLPFTLYYFGKLSIIAIIANLIVIPLIGIIVANGIFTLTISLVSTGIAKVYAASGDLGVYLLNKLVMFCADIPYSFIYIREFSFYDGIIFYLLLVILFFFLRKSGKIIYKIVIITLITVSFFILEKLDNKKLLPEGKLSIVMINVGQGDSFLIKYPNGNTALIDGGEANEYFDNGKRVIIPLLRFLGIEKINYGFITHLDSDHLNGFLSLLGKVEFDHIYKPLERSGFEKDAAVESLIELSRIPIRYFHKDTLAIGECRMYLLNDTNNVKYDLYDINNKSGVIKLVYNENEFLFTGDIEKEAERDLVSAYGDFLKSDVLKAAHHGSKTSTTDEFLSSVNPQSILISAGEHNRFKHPSKSVLDKLEEKNILPLRTDKLGAVILQSDGKKITQVKWE